MRLRRYSCCVFLSYLWITYTGYCQCFCPQIAELDTRHEIVVNVTASGFTEFKWTRPDTEFVTTCDVNQGTCHPLAGNYSASLIENNENSILTINKVKESDSGLWTLQDLEKNSTHYNVCHLVTAPRPQCNITSSRSTDDLDLGDNVTLTADIRGYYCPEPVEFSLITGDVTERFAQNSTTNVTNTVIVNSFSITSGRLGKVGLNYTCNDDSWMLLCDGVKELIQTTTTTASTTATTSSSTATATTKATTTAASTTTTASSSTATASSSTATSSSSSTATSSSSTATASSTVATTSAITTSATTATSSSSSTTPSLSSTTATTTVTMTTVPPGSEKASNNIIIIVVVVVVVVVVIIVLVFIVVVLKCTNLGHAAKKYILKHENSHSRTDKVV